MIKFKLSIKRSKFSPRAFLAGGMIWGMMVLSVLGQGITSSWEETEDTDGRNHEQRDFKT